MNVGKYVFLFSQHRLWTLDTTLVTMRHGIFAQVGRSVDCWWIHFATILHISSLRAAPSCGMVVIVGERSCPFHNDGMLLSLIGRSCCFQMGAGTYAAAYRLTSELMEMCGRR